jgi:ankyrin repeat protein
MRIGVALIAFALLLPGPARALDAPVRMRLAQTPPSPSDLRIYAGLHAAAAKGDAAEIERLVAAGEKPDIQDGNSRTPLHVAAFGGHQAAARTLLRLGANPNALDAQRYDVVTIAAVRDDVEMLKLALAGGADPRAITSPYNGTALIAAAHLGHAEVVRILIAAKAPLDHVNNLGWTALMEAVVLGDGGRRHTDTVEALVKAGANLDIPDRQGITPLGQARRRGYADMAKILESAGAR